MSEKAFIQLFSNRTRIDTFVSIKMNSVIKKQRRHAFQSHGLGYQAVTSVGLFFIGLFFSTRLCYLHNAYIDKKKKNIYVYLRVI